MKAAPDVPVLPAQHPFRGVAAVTVDQIIAELHGRVGLGEEWDKINEVWQADIREKLIELVLAAIVEVCS